MKQIIACSLGVVALARLGQLLLGLGNGRAA
jgi:hypothetical protein